jgi:signal transduction histidine kinase/ligand-binding sensor domain-containing protein/DNA-binding response OmpR family regulator
MKSTAWVLLLTFTFCYSAFAEKIHFESISLKDGLPYNSIKAIEQDNLGYMWFATELGLARFDGYQIHSYLADNSDPNSIANPFVQALEIENDDVLWVGTSQGLNRFDRDTDNFTLFVHNANNTNSLSGNDITAIQKDNNSILWVATGNGLDRFDTKTGQFTHFIHDPTNLLSIPHQRIRKIFRTRNGKLLIGSNAGLAQYDRKRNIFRLIQLQKGVQPIIRTISESDSGSLWIGTQNGLFKYEPTDSSVTKIAFKHKVKTITTSLIDNFGNLWIGTLKHGVFRIDPLNRITNIRPDKNAPNSLGDYIILDIFQDRSGIIWVGTAKAGVNMFDPRSLLFGAFDNKANSLSCLQSADVKSAFALTTDSVLLGTTSGLVEVDFEQKHCNSYLINNSDFASPSRNITYAISKDNSENLWIGKNRGLGKFDPNTGSYEDIGKPLSDLPVHLLLNHGEFLIAGTYRGVYKINTSSRKISPIFSTVENDERNYIYSIRESKDKSVWIASTKGVLKIDKQLSKVTLVKFQEQKFNDKTVTALEIDPLGIVWLTIDGEGLFKYSPKNNTLIPSGEKLGLKLKTGFSALNSDKLGNLWISTLNQGLIKIDKTRTILTNYQMSDGLVGEVFNFFAFTRFSDNKVFFGGPSGFNIFDPESIEINLTAPQVSLTHLKRFGKIVIPKKDYDGFSIDKHISKLESLNLTHRETIIGLDFVALHYADPDRLRYWYKLEGLDENWTQTNAQNRGVTYNGLGAGEYTFRLRAQTKNGVWSEKDVALKINVSPAPWASPTAYVIYFIAFVLAVFSIIKYRTRSLEKRATELENTVSKRTNELATEKEKVEQLLSRKNEEFANVSHEFRTPLTLIIGPIKQLLSWNPEDKYKRKLNIVQRNSLRLLRMVDQLLNLETFRVKAITQKSPQAISKTIQLISEAFSDLATEKNITFVINKIDPVCFDFTPDAIEKIILNILSNAIKYTKLDGNITVQATREGDSQYVIQVTDTGIGIAKDKLSKVFERFNRVMDENSEQVTGSGIGLALVKSLVESHDGSVELKSELGKGTTITVTLPIINEVDESHINVYQNDEIIAMELMNVSSSNLPKDSLAEPTTQILSSEKPTILIIEDNDDMRQYIVESIAEKFNTIVAADGQAGLELAIQEVPDLIISDIMMPKLDGYQTTRALRETQITNHIPVVLLTARGDRDSRLKGWEEKADEYITKPFDVEELLIRISNLIEIRNILKRRFSETVFEFTDQNNQQQETESESLSIVEINTQRLQQEFIDQLNQKIEVVYMETDLSVSDIASSVNMGERQFYRKLRSIVDMTPNEYLRRFRLEKSKEILRAGKSASYTAFEVGFSSQNYFSKCFKAQYSMTPTQFVNQK